MTPKYTAGQWVRFYQAGTLVIGEIRYVRKSTVGNIYYATSIGEVAEDSILEAR